MNNLQQTSLDAFASIQETLTDKEQAVYDVFLEHGDSTIYEVMRVLGWAINCVSGRITGLKNKKKIIDTGFKKLSPSGRQCSVWSCVK